MPILHGKGATWERESLVLRDCESSALQKEDVAGELRHRQPLHACIELTSTPLCALACHNSRASVHCLWLLTRPARFFRLAGISRSNGQNPCLDWPRAALSAWSAVAEFTAPCVTAGFVNNRNTPSCMSGFVAQAR